MRNNPFKIYAGDSNNVAHEVRSVYFGSLSAPIGTAKKVKKIYAGDSNNVARIVYKEILPWYLCEGISESNVIAAYRFSGMSTEDEALVNINKGAQYTLTKSSSITWDTGTGFFIPATNNVRIYNSSLTNLYESVLSIVFKFSGAVTTATNRTIGGSFLHINRFLTIRGTGSGAEVHYNNKPAIARTGTADTMKCSPAAIASGVLAGTFGSTADTTLMYIDGVQQTLANGGGNNSSSYQEVWNSNYRGLIAQPSSTTKGSFYVQGIALYNVALTAAQHAEIAYSMNEDL